MLVLAPWQLGKNAAVHQRNETIADPTAPIPIEELRSPDASPLATDEWRMVTMTGRYLPDREIVLRRRSAQGRSAVEIVSPFQLPDGTTIMVNRGYLLRGADDPTDAPAPPTGDTTVVGRLRAPEDTGRFSLPRVDDDEVVAYALDPTRLGDAVGLRVPPMAVQLVADQPGVLGVVAPPEPDAGPYLSYGVQWIAFGVLAPLGLVYAALAYTRRKPDPRHRPTALTTKEG
nr:SURF1 family protein [Gordonia humi]